MFDRAVLICTILFSAPSLWAALYHQSISLEEAGIRILIAWPVAAILVGLVRLAARPRPHPDPDEPARPGGADEVHHPANR